MSSSAWSLVKHFASLPVHTFFSDFDVMSQWSQTVNLTEDFTTRYALIRQSSNPVLLFNTRTRSYYFFLWRFFELYNWCVSWFDGLGWWWVVVGMRHRPSPRHCVGESFHTLHYYVTSTQLYPIRPDQVWWPRPYIRATGALKTRKRDFSKTKQTNKQNPVSSSPIQFKLGSLNFFFTYMNKMFCLIDFPSIFRARHLSRV